MTGATPRPAEHPETPFGLRLRKSPCTETTEPDGKQRSPRLPRAGNGRSIRPLPSRLRDIASTLGITERSAYAIVTDLADAEYVVKERDMAAATGTRSSITFR
jgi:hypothetical protein